MGFVTAQMHLQDYSGNKWQYDFGAREFSSGPGGFLKFESTWQVTDDGFRLSTVIPMGGPR